MNNNTNNPDAATIRDRIKAAIMGYAIGDALGKGTEFMSSAVAKGYYPNGLTSFSQIIRDAHRSQWKKNEWTNDTELVLLTADALINDEGKYFSQSHAYRLKEWFANSNGDVVPLFRWVLSNPDYLNDPKGTAAKVWRDMVHLEASNEALGRCLILSFLPVNYMETVADGCRLTHHDSRCISSAAVIAHTAHSLLWHNRVPEFDELKEIVLNTDERTLPYLENAFFGELESFRLDNPEKYWYTRLAMGSAMWSLLRCESMEEALRKVVMEGGDADTNASLSLALIGLKHGTTSLPQDLAEEIANASHLIEIADKLADTLLKVAGEGID